LKKISIWILIFGISLALEGNVYFGLSYSIAIILALEILIYSNKKFVFREWALLLYAINYLVAPAITYKLPDGQVLYGMKIVSDQYYTLALPGFIFLCIGMYILPTSVFSVNTKKVDQSATVNKSFLIKVAALGIILRFAQPFVAGELGFVFYLLAMIRFVASFALFSIDKKTWFISAAVLLIELISAFIKGMYHDAIMWTIFFGLYFIYVSKPSLRTRLIGAASLVVFVLFIQAIKSVYRSEFWSGEKEATLLNIYEIGSENATSENIYGENNLLSTLNRGNQAWILASTVDNMDNTKNFQGLTNVNKYFEAALLPRFLAPDKLKSGDNEIFNEFSGHAINEGTSMGLGIFADGYIAFGTWGVYIFAFALGLIFALTFKLVERWSKISPFYVLLLLPLLNYAVRPDCELQTTINHLFKGILLYGFLVYLTRKRFTLDSQENQRKLLHLNLINNRG
jgi:hypothetical protein